MLIPPPGYVFIGASPEDFRGTLRCSCGFVTVDEMNGWAIFTDRADGDTFHRVTFAACPAHHLLYRSPPPFYS